MKTYLLVFLCLAVATLYVAEGLRRIPFPASTRCRDAYDCCTGECCVEQSPYKGRKKRDLSTEYVGVCRPLGTVGSTCYVGGPDIPNPNPLVSYDYCPCNRGLSCGV